mmetsp:Transcript_21943/g.50013  ORF Transcript_21943/g.50013 Transcript_21943/m.50013 type:complete len:261 (-) Transcript_21943:240-1022(-)
MRSLGLGRVDGHVGLIPVRLRLQKILLPLRSLGELIGGEHSQKRKDRQPPRPSRQGQGGHDAPGRHHPREDARQRRRRGHPQQKRAHGPRPRPRPGQGDAHEGGQARPPFPRGAHAQRRRLGLRPPQNGVHEGADGFVAQEEEEGHDGGHVAQDADGEDVLDGHAHPDAHRDGAAELHHGEGGDEGQDGEVGQAEGLEVPRHFLARVQVLEGGGGGSLGREGGGGGRRQKGDEEEGEAGAFHQKQEPGGEGSGSGRSGGG